MAEDEESQVPTSLKMNLSLSSELWLALSLFLGALLYTSVGHAGASAYIAIMALFGVAPATMRPTALVLNILVASFASWRYLRVVCSVGACYGRAL